MLTLSQTTYGSVGFVRSGSTDLVLNCGFSQSRLNARRRQDVRVSYSGLVVA